MSNMSKNVMCGAFTGALYKSTLGIIPTCVGAVLGSTIIGTFTKINQHLNAKGIIAFEMRF
jgi:import inner membrane translocase subunit TIM23